MRSETCLIEAGYLRPNRSKDTPIERICAMADDLPGLIEGRGVKLAVVEITTGKRAGRLGSNVSGKRVLPVLENDWTAGVSKVVRQYRVAAMFPEYRERMRADGGGDIADAIGLGLWWFRKKHLESSAEGEVQDKGSRLSEGQLKRLD